MRLRDSASIVAYFGGTEIDELQVAVDARREDRAGRSDGGDGPAPEGETNAAETDAPGRLGAEPARSA